MKIIFTFCFLLNNSFVYAQLPPVEVADLTVKVPSLSTREFYYGFEAGDELIFSFSEGSKKTLKQIEIVEYPVTTKYSGTNVSITEKRIKINNKGVYIFKLTNNALVQRVCSVRIGRIPGDNKTVNFNSNISWKELTDTTYTILTKQELVKYDTTYSYLTKRELVKVDTSAVELFSKSEQVAAQTTIGKSSESILQVDLPVNKISPLQETETVAWAYWIGVGQEGHLAFEKNRKAFLNAAGNLASATGNPLIGLALNSFSFLPSGNAGSNVAYYFLPNLSDAQTFINQYEKGGYYQFEKGDGVSAFGRKERPLQGRFYIGLHNDNIHSQINVTVKIVAVVVRKVYEERKYRQATTTPRYENKIIKQPIVTIKKVPININ